MAIAIKSVPILKDKAAVSFNRNAKASVAKKATIKFTKEIAASSKILAKAQF
ncbi:hypothetical protein [Fluviicola taffensis]|uniref:Uncharacterized protein n=1 Tax=Fluviicola taffensis (strain DSM 16823 / NCIMB 13979 / RW262) TaxID=755732 RepID=F2I9P6_FLUTR|nr:hypothetical protein [Fluviicola taffensis]AEA43042.1 hypothetical protein Fluta_1044 [Fluviicola taffensis DSM 16823]